MATRAAGASSELRSRAISAPFAIVALTVVVLAGGVGACIHWLLTGDPTWINTFFRYPGALFFLLMASIELGLTLRVWRQFEPQDELGSAWALLVLAASCHTLSAFFAQILGQDSRLNPLVASGPGRDTIGSLREFGVLVGGPLHMVVLAQGLFLVLRTYKRLGLLVTKLTAVDYLLLGAVGAYTVVHLYEVAGILDGSPSFPRLIGWASDPLLSILLVEAVFLRRSVAQAGWGLVSKCWGAFCAAIFLTSLGDVGIWATWRGYLPPSLVAVSWYIWFPASSAYALGPAYQLEALRTARLGLRSS